LKFPEIDPFRTVMPLVLSPASIAAAPVGGTEFPVIVKPARSIVTKLAVIDRQALPARPLKVRFLTSLYELTYRLFGISRFRSVLLLVHLVLVRRTRAISLRV
jgi:hypothetical protein